ncbi:MAG: type II toxin-antitoxin system HicA family toxin [Firmicutes bacterium]|nr:type II toxin-antitoxin system HicA family toxin [Bacillota bacterium]
MTKADKRLDRIRRNPRGVSFEELMSIAKRRGFTVRSVRGSHFHLRHPSISEILTLPARSPVKPVYVKAVLKLVDRLNEEE